MEIKKKFIGSRQWSALLSRWVSIERGKEEYYASLGFVHIFEKKKPKLIKNVENTETINFESDSNSDRADNSESSTLSV